MARIGWGSPRKAWEDVNQEVFIGHQWVERKFNFFPQEEHFSGDVSGGRDEGPRERRASFLDSIHPMFEEMSP